MEFCQVEVAELMKRTISLIIEIKILKIMIEILLSVGVNRDFIVKGVNEIDEINEISEINEINEINEIDG